MQLSLTTTLPRHPRAAVLRPLVPLSREAAMSQLDQIAAASSHRIARQDGLGGVSTVLALVGGLVLVGAAAMWRAPADTAPGAAPAMSAPAPAVAALPREEAASPPVLDAPALAVVPREPAPEAVTAAVVAGPAPAVVEPSAEELAQKARARQLAEARRKAAALAQERMLAEEAQRLQAAVQRRDAELAALRAEEQQLRQQRAAAEAAARQAQAVAATITRRSVRETCAGRGFFAEAACHVRECARGEQQSDPLCLRQRENEEAQRSASAAR
jgi:type IV secretory pathway VirB10-like protein